MVDINVNKISKTYTNGTKALEDVSFEIDSGEFYGLIGVNGAGKTTLINSLIGQIKLDSGEISVLGFDASTEGEKVRANVGILPEKESPLSFMTPEEYFDFIGDVRGIEQKELNKKVNSWAERLDLVDEMDSMNRHLSRGQQQKVLFAGTFLHEPEVVFIDEPLANLDPIIQEELKDYLREYNNKGNTIILSTHHLEVATELCEKLGVMNNGTMIGEHNVEDLDSHDDIRELLTNNGDLDE